MIIHTCEVRLLEYLLALEIGEQMSPHLSTYDAEHDRIAEDMGSAAAALNFLLVLGLALDDQIFGQLAPSLKQELRSQHLPRYRHPPSHPQTTCLWQDSARATKKNFMMWHHSTNGAN